MENEFDIFVANDLDTMTAAFLAARLKGKPLVYDAHEYFTELPEVVQRPFVKWAWKTVEKRSMPTVHSAYTINQAYADLFKEEYNLDFEIVRNATVLEEKNFPSKSQGYILYQGAVNEGRGVEQMIEAMQFIDRELWICGSGDQYDDCVQLVKNLNLKDRVKFLGWVEPEKLKSITLNAWLGFTFFTNKGMSYYYSMANRFFDYFHNAIPQLAVDFPEYRNFNKRFEVSILLDELSPRNIADVMLELEKDDQKYARLKSNCLQARKEVNWQTEAKKLVALYKQIEKECS